MLNSNSWGCIKDAPLKIVQLKYKNIFTRELTKVQHDWAKVQSNANRSKTTLVVVFVAALFFGQILIERDGGW